MTPEEWQRVRPILESALELPSEDRRAFVKAACGDDSLGPEVESLLEAHDWGAEVLRTGDAAGELQEDFGEPGFQLAPGKRIGKYEIVGEIARGGMGAVYRAIRADGQYKQQVALKIVRAEVGWELTASRFRKEQQILASLDHPNIARILDGSSEKGIPYFVMELIDGVPITRYCDQHRLDIDARLRLFRTVCAAVHYAHQHLVIHRDIKPTNILVTSEGAPKLLDFGIAKILDPNVISEDSTLTAGALWLMTPEYAGPEQLRGEAITTATDVYSLGLVLYELLAGRPPYRHPTRSPHEIARTLMESQPRKPSSVAAEPRPATIDSDGSLECTSGFPVDAPERLCKRLSGDLDNIVLKAIRTEPRERYSSVEQFSEDIRRHLEGLPVAASNDSFWYRSSKFFSRHKLGIAVGTLLALAVVGGLATTLYEAHIARMQRARADARFADVRELANSLMFDVHDSIQDLPGSTPARKLLVERALRYLDTLSRDASSDPSLQRELATAYEKVGTVQGNPFGANLGDTTGALQSYQKSLAIRETLAKNDPGNLEDTVALVRARRLVAVVMANRGDSDGLVELQRAIVSGEALRVLAPTNLDALKEIQTDYRMQGTLLEGIGDYQGSANSFRKALDTLQLIAQVSTDRNLQRDLSTAEAKLGHELACSGTRPDGIIHLRRAIAGFETLSGDQTDLESLRRLGLTHAYLGGTFLLDGESASAVREFRTAQDISSGLQSTDPANAVFQDDLAYIDASLGDALALSGDKESGLQQLTQARKLSETQLKRDPAYSEAALHLTSTLLWQGEVFLRTARAENALASFQAAETVWKPVSDRNPGTNMEADLALIHIHMGFALLLLGHLDQAAEQFERGRTIVESITTANPNILEAQYVQADAYSGLGDVSNRLSSRFSDADPDHFKNRVAARIWYQRSLAVWNNIANPSTVTPSGYMCGSPKSVAKRLAKHVF